MMTGTDPTPTRGAHDADDEQDLLAIVLHGYPTHSLGLDPADLYEPKHELIYRAAMQAGSNIVAIRHHLDASAEQTDYLLDLYGRDWAIPANAPTLVGRIQANAARRRLADLAAAQKQAVEQGSPVDAIIEHVRRELDKINTTSEPADTTPADLLDQVFAQIESDAPRGASLPWPDLDTHLQGLQPGRLYVVGARPGVGKSMLGQNISEHFAAHHKAHVAHFSLEMPATEVLMRMLAHQSGVDSHKLQAGAKHILASDWDKLTKASALLVNQPIHIVDAATQTTASITAHCQRIKARHGLGLVVIDYLQLITPRDRSLNREQQVAESTRALKILAKDLDVPVLLLSQLRRPEPGQANKRPGLTDLRESGAIEQDADVVIVLHQPDPEQAPWDLHAHVAKNRSGQLGSAKLLLAGHVASIRSALRSAA